MKEFGRKAKITEVILTPGFSSEPRSFYALVSRSCSQKGVSKHSEPDNGIGQQRQQNGKAA